MAFASAVRADRTSLQLDQMTDDGQTETQPSLLPRRTAVLLPEALEQMWQELRRDANSVVLNGDDRLLRRGGNPNLDATAARRELDRMEPQRLRPEFACSQWLMPQSYLFGT